MRSILRFLPSPWIPVVAVVATGACAEREPPPDADQPDPAPAVVESLPPQPDTLVSDSVMARDTLAPVPE